LQIVMLEFLDQWIFHKLQVFDHFSSL